jgi:hypothetical protein
MYVAHNHMYDSTVKVCYLQRHVIHIPESNLKTSGAVDFSASCGFDEA